MSVLKTYGADISYKPSKTYAMQDGHIVGFIDGVQAVEQAANLMLSISRYYHPIYSWDYGNELNDFIGKPREYVQGDIKRRIEETLLQDDRIEGISNFTLTFEKECALISFTVQSTFGEFNMERSVPFVK